MAGVVGAAAELLGEDREVQRHPVGARGRLGVGDVVRESPREEGPPGRRAVPEDVCKKGSGE